MAVKTCLLVTDDPDDHHAVSEALASISDRTVLLNIIDSQKAVLLLNEGVYKPNYIMLDMSMHGIDVNNILNVIDESAHYEIPILIYGSRESFSQLGDRRNLRFLDKDFEYSELRAFLRDLII